MKFAVLCAVAGSAAAAPEWSDDSAARLEAGLAVLADEHDVVGVALGIVIDGDLVFASGFGNAALGQTRPITPSSVFHWASVSKPFVAVAIMQLVEQKRLALDDLLVERLPYFEMADARYREITLQQLLSHTAGMPDVEDYEWGNPQTDAGALKRWALQQRHEKLLFAPGTDRKYSNIGFELLGLVVQETSGMPFERYMAESILRPLGMDDSSFIAGEIDGSLRVKGHVGKEQRRIASAYPYNRRHAPSSTLNTNITDMARFAGALLGDGQVAGARILDAATVRRMWTPVWTAADDPDRAFGLGWNVGRRWGGILAASHGGGDDGFRSFLYIAPEEDAAVFMASNDETIPVGTFVRAALETLFPEQAAMEAAEQ